MTISGFSFVRNGVKLYYPVVESITSILPLVDEFVVAVGRGDPDDDTRERIAAIPGGKVKIIDTEWDEKHFDRGIINALQTDIAKEACSGDWLFYLQADEVVHEKDLPVIEARCRELEGNAAVEGLLFRYLHFWGDYDHVHRGHGWYSREIRVVRNRPDIHSWQSAQSFRSFESYDHPRQREGHRKLRVAPVDAHIYHYGWVRPPHLMQNKRRSLDSVHWGRGKAEAHYDRAPEEFDYGPLDRVGTFRGTHPRVMQDRIAAMDWKDKLQLSGPPNPHREPHKHEQWKYRVLTFLENNVLKRRIGEFKNYRLLEV